MYRICAWAQLAELAEPRERIRVLEREAWGLGNQLAALQAAMTGKEEEIAELNNKVRV